MFSFNFAPHGWAMCNGQLLPIDQNSALFSLLGTTYGGNGQTTFGLPDLRGRVPMHVGSSLTLGENAGEETHTLIASEMPTHGHPVAASSAAADQPVPTGNSWAVGTTNPYAASANVVLNLASLAGAGGSQLHQNMSPYLVIGFCIALSGIFPSRP